MYVHSSTKRGMRTQNPARNQQHTGTTMWQAPSGARVPRWGCTAPACHGIHSAVHTKASSSVRQHFYKQAWIGAICTLMLKATCCAAVYQYPQQRPAMSKTHVWCGTGGSPSALPSVVNALACRGTVLQLSRPLALLVLPHDVTLGRIALQALPLLVDSRARVGQGLAARRLCLSDDALRDQQHRNEHIGSAQQLTQQRGEGWTKMLRR